MAMARARARTVVEVSVACIEPPLLLLGLLLLLLHGCGGLGCQAQGRIMLGTHGSNRREGVARLPGRSWPAGGDDALTLALMRLQSDRALGWIAHRNRRLNAPKTAGGLSG